MYLEKLDIQGFKSFANKNTLVFPGMLNASKRGITAVVGPNGSGKSNVADSVRWALGEQSMKTLRGKKSEDIIFSGSDLKGKLGMAEVSMHLNNESKKAPIDYSQLVITRRLYRNGDSEYMINNNRVRLSDIQMLLAKAKFGQKTYSVIGQGMVEGFLNTTLSERKEFFDEATGVKQYQIKRDDSLNKLRSSYENLAQAQMLLTEIEPRLKSLTRQVNKLRKRDELEKELKVLQLQYYSSIWHELNSKFNEANNQFLELEKSKIVKDKKLVSLNQELEQMEQESVQESKFSELQAELNKKQEVRDEINRKLMKLEVQAEAKLESNGQFDLSFLINKKDELAEEIKQKEEEISNLEKNLVYDKEEAQELSDKKDEINQALKDINDDLLRIGQEAGSGNIKEVNKRLKMVQKKLLGLLEEEDIKKINKLVQEIEQELRDIISLSEEQEDSEGNSDIRRMDKVQEKLETLTKEKEEINAKINDNNLRISARSERVKLLQEQQENTKKELNDIKNKLEQKSGEFDFGKLNEEQKELRRQFEQIDKEMQEIREKIGESSQEEEKKKSRLFALQKETHKLQNEVNELNNQLNDIKVNSARHETKLEDLEIEIREELGSLKEVKEKRQELEQEIEVLKEKIGNLKRQLDQIGGIDPQIEEEYKETSERFEFLDGQVSDLTKAIESLEKIIKELDLIIKEQFDKEFKLIAKKFEEYFKILFNGGTAKIIKVMEEEKKKEEIGEEAEENKETEIDTKKDKNIDIADIKRIKFLQKHNATGLAGIEIQAVPPGKKIKSVAMLSGGERALTAIALICAIISANPSPFVVLDEVDAALDEANSERLAKILDELSHKTQFIIITHNRATMRKANILYGVTMANDGVSKLLSIKLEEAKKQIE
jgi:chromosome segregation protein